jgi:transcriptional regulator with XRE-family HTH domain
VEEEDFWTRLERIVDARFPRKKVTSELGIALNSFTTWEKRKTYPSAHVMVHLARMLDVTVEYLITGTDSTDPWLREHRQLIEDLKTLAPEALEDQEAAIHAIAERRRRELGKDSVSG